MESWGLGKGEEGKRVGEDGMRRERVCESGLDAISEACDGRRADLYGGRGTCCFSCGKWR